MNLSTPPSEFLPSLHFFSPVFPSSRGNGLAMRAGSMLKMLAARFQVHLIVIPVYGTATPELETEMKPFCASWKLAADPGGGPSWWCRWNPCSPPEWKKGSFRWPDAVRAAVAGTSPERIYLFRFYLLPFVERTLPPGIPVWLDLDERESSARSSQRQLYAQNAEYLQAFRMRWAALTYRYQERKQLGRFDRIFVASQKEADRLLGMKLGRSVVAIPNSYPEKQACLPRNPDGVFRMLFVGSFGHYPNRDAVFYFHQKILPLLRNRLGRSIEVVIVGNAASRELRQLNQVPEMTIVGWVEDLEPLYRDCDVVIVPLRAGGGTRIKILEAFSHRRPVVATTIGAEGLEVVPGMHLLVADTPETFAASCLQLAEHAELGNSVAQNGHDFYRQWHTPKKVEALFSRVLDQGPETSS